MICIMPTLSTDDVEKVRAKVQSWHRRLTRSPRRWVSFAGGPLDGMRVSLEQGSGDRFICVAHVMSRGPVLVVYEHAGGESWRFEQVESLGR